MMKIRILLTILGVLEKELLLLKIEIKNVVHYVIFFIFMLKDVLKEEILDQKIDYFILHSLFKKL